MSTRTLGHEGQSLKTVTSVYELVTHVQTGGQAEVWKARQLTTSQPGALRDCVAIKLFRPTTELITQRFRIAQEIDALEQLRHPNIEEILDHNFELVVDGKTTPAATPFIVKGWLEGENLYARANRRFRAEHNRFELGEVLQIMNDVGGALAYAHEQRRAHRDLSPGNIMSVDDRYVLIDFGYARDLAADGPRFTICAIGTPYYRAPELRDESTVRDGGAPADVFSLGFLAWSLLTGHRFNPDPAWEMLVADEIKYEHSLHQVEPRVPPRIAGVLDRAVRKNPGERWQTAGEFLEALEAAELEQEDPPEVTVRSGTPAILEPDPSKTDTRKKASKTKMLLSALVLIGAAIGLTVYVRSHNRPGVAPLAPSNVAQAPTPRPSSAEERNKLGEDKGAQPVDQARNEAGNRAGREIRSTSSQSKDFVATKTDELVATKTAVVLEGDTSGLRSAISSRLNLPMVDELGSRVRVAQQLVISVSSKTLDSIYAQPRTSVTLSWRLENVVQGQSLARGGVEGLIANGPSEAASMRRALGIALDSMVVQLKTSGIIFK